MATATRKKLYNQEQQIYLQNRIIKLLEGEQKTAATVNSEEITDLNNPGEMEKLLSQLKK
ncbi:MAG TPA: hypothetical protein VG738_14925 [Chitinophagaceae bacterium]|nr:hypothetical protein [Chitinophagaceae bacterium]